ncbi:carboxylesterase family protein [Streptomyces thermodiastaticus]|uniref:carboxylesterase family protein n=1 Tax=Streptomyces thermodiastaticus TaxID=44061 RepID=UPI001E3625B3|nr:carboxylesterase family protein [Streptomyces thermodiastaticus]MCE7549566.1 carboxylesterase family protein [Streptomyces thermodiastaticus]
MLGWYDGAALAAEGDVVVVRPNYRLGSLCYLVLDGVGEGNLGLFDQLQALR